MKQWHTVPFHYYSQNDEKGERFVAFAPFELGRPYESRFAAIDTMGQNWELKPISIEDISAPVEIPEDYGYERLQMFRADQQRGRHIRRMYFALALVEVAEEVAKV